MTSSTFTQPSLFENISLVTNIDFEGKTVRIVYADNKQYFVANDVLNAIDSSTKGNYFAKIIKSHLSDDHLMFRKIQTRNGAQSIRIISEDAAAFVLSRVRKKKAKALAKKLNLKNCVSVNVEAKYIQIILNAFKHLDPIEQFTVDSFRIDLYLSKSNIAIECDEFGHKSYGKKKDLTRQRKITKKLGCKWVRFNPDLKDFCIGDVINELIQMTSSC